MSKTNGLAIQQREPLVMAGGSLTQYSQRLDSNADYLSDAPTPQVFARIIQNADDGEIGALLRLNEEMEAKDAHLQGVSATRRRALTALEWSIEPAESEKKQKLADEAAAFVQDELEALYTLPDTLEHLSTAIGPGLAVSELVWAKGRLQETIDVPGHRLKSDPMIGNEVLVETEEYYQGIPALPGKFIVYAPNARAGYPIAVTMTRACAWLYILKHYARADWSTFSELFGMPFRVALCGENVPDDVRATIGVMLRDMTSDGWAVLPSSDDITLDWKESAHGEGPYAALIEWVEKKQSILYLGQTGTTEIGEHGSFAAIKIHDNVRSDLLISDIKNEARMIRQSLIRPMCLLKWPRREVPLPHFVREVHQAKDLEAERLSLDQLRAANEFGLDVDADVRYEMLGIPKPKPVQTAPDEVEKIEEVVTDEG